MNSDTCRWNDAGDYAKARPYAPGFPVYLLHFEFYDVLGLFLFAGD